MQRLISTAKAEKAEDLRFPGLFKHKVCGDIVVCMGGKDPLATVLRSGSGNMLGTVYSFVPKDYEVFFGTVTISNEIV